MPLGHIRIGGLVTRGTSHAIEAFSPFHPSPHLQLQRWERDWKLSSITSGQQSCLYNKASIKTQKDTAQTASVLVNT